MMISGGGLDKIFHVTGLYLYMDNGYEHGIVVFQFGLQQEKRKIVKFIRIWNL